MTQKKNKTAGNTGSAASRLPRFITLLQQATELFEDEARSRRGSASLLASIQQARDFYARAAQTPVRAVDRMRPGSVAEVRMTSWLEDRLVSSGVLHCFTGPLTGHDDFQRILRVRLGEESYRLTPLSREKVGDRWSESANSRDENHDRYDYEILAIHSVGS